ncbi:hypothetical protein DDR33_10925 [Pararcticibacter amylolyticus]|uniref:Cell division protein FtsX n=2 Tax=Pararcticibacter amylolyticus TaxID=2173175 RepID=A0A2U2PGN3_9SPHI|nr:hypothetical protein DDR33_10925 [Pararcticibacter amylolyticus]
MVLNYFKSSLRYLYRNKMFTALNILGLSIGLSACIVISGVVYYEFSFDRKLPDRENIYRVVSDFVYEGRESLNGGVTKPLPEAIRAQVAGIKRVVPVFVQHLNTAEVSGGDQTKKIEEPEDIVSTDNTYFSMVPYHWIAGNSRAALSKPDAVVLTQSRAKEYFPGVDLLSLIGKTILYNDTLKKEVSGVVKDLEGPTSFTGKEFFAIPLKTYSATEWATTNGDNKLYIQLNPHTDRGIVSDRINRILKNKWNVFKDEPFWRTTKVSNRLIAFDDLHFTPDISEGVHKASREVMYGLILIGVFLLLLASINYINLSTAQIWQRTREFGVRKTLGSGRLRLIGHVLTETFLITLLALCLSFLFSKLIFFALKNIIPEGAEQYLDPGSISLFIAAVLILVPLIAGSYPAYLITRVNPLRIIRNHMLLPRSSSLGLRKGLIIFQFCVAQIFIVCTFIAASQIRYLMKKDPGFNREAVLLVEVPWKLRWKEQYKSKQFSLINELRNVQGITDVSLGDPPLTDGYSSSLFSYTDSRGKKAEGQLYRKVADTSYLNLYKIQLIAGRNLIPADTAKEMLINETAVKHFGFKSAEDAVGKMLDDGGKKLTIAGVVKDFHSQSFYNNIVPVSILMEKQDLATFNIKLSTEETGNWQTTIESIRKKWSQFYPSHYFDYKFYDQHLESIYKQERNISLLINLACIISVVISCLGLFGLAALTAFQRTKEIGIRKVMGATTIEVVQMLSKDFMKLVLIAIALGSPVAWYVTNKWLEGFAYRVPVQLWVFCAAAATAITIASLTVSSQAIRAARARPVDSLRNE